ncbi:MAG: biotin--[acetyl-CoA-carboxylase] ligase [Candidatus Schekmanbacteria bacterium RBG_13_48_7]|uniref:biotin--[biotin carboxyl-carrier protein] ligase n=1 Tax=Candidatus Schekmanbacteria bacterium RBG_13_48_7 TaxID=1817878 RepID=A0A1F7RZG2_9BACT|nr:MAG: biotin--[acetyl-CoA-carboxylase] ligase [Candidatus Schekmanbacteria bacterium RBG_13_48_7]
MRKKRYQFIELEHVDSTNAHMRRLFEHKFEEGTILTAETQSYGRGRNGKIWQSPPGGLYMTVLLKPVVFSGNLTILHQVCGIGVARGIEEVCPVEIKVKWPNDLLIQGKKIAGILIESIIGSDKVEAVFVGIGVNVNLCKEDLPVRTIFPASSLLLELDSFIDLNFLKHSIAKNLMNVYDHFLIEGFDRLLIEWNQRSMLTGKNVHIQIDDKRVFGKVEGISGRGGLLIRLSDTEQIKEFINGEIIGIEG